MVLRETSTRREPVAPVGLFATWSLSGPVTLGFTVSAYTWAARQVLALIGLPLTSRFSEPCVRATSVAG